MVRVLIFGFAFCALLSPWAIAQDNKNPRVVIETSAGKITIELFAEKAPFSVKNFLQYAEEKHYDGTIFHRVIADFMIQGGGFEPGLKEKKTREPVRNEAGNGLSNLRGTLAMARTDDADSATAQFFVNVVDNKRLDRENAKDTVGYTVFGKVIDGMDVVDKIRAVETGMQQGFKDVPVKDVVITSVRRVK
ncbi:MAG: peptidyl-prolyl cis-trans isomerase [Planctomycetes bacterium]|nr:peptidyl-prolyl cis-trans isomerase [Planctomycetota bacterium]